MGSDRSGKVVAATYNPTRPWGPRPYHRPECPYVNNSKSIPANWVAYRDISSAARAGHDRPCRRCLP